MIAETTRSTQMHFYYAAHSGCIHVAIRISQFMATPVAELVGLEPRLGAMPKSRSLEMTRCGAHQLHKAEFAFERF